MRTRRPRQFAALALATGVACMTAWPAAADDTEVYLGSNAGQTKVLPNVLFIMDTSGSMDTKVTTTVGVYDPGVTYNGDCRSDRYYWSTRGQPPSCRTRDYIDATAFKCADASNALSAGGSGFYLGRLARFKPGTGRGKGPNSRGQWTTLDASAPSDPVECEQDFGIHGESDGSSARYPADESDGGPWRSNAQKAVDWRRTGTHYTLYSANYLNWRENYQTTYTQTRLEIVQDTLNRLLDGSSGINTALMRFQGSEGGYFLAPMRKLEGDHRDTMTQAVNALKASGMTPLAETLYEASLFFRGEPVKYGKGYNVPGVLDPENTARYQSPIEYQCQKNFVVLLSDGAPTYDDGADKDIAGLPGFRNVTGASKCSGNCLDELAHWMYERDLISTLNDKQNVITYTVGFATDQPLLGYTARKGGGRYYTADSADSLANAFTQIITEVLAVNTTFVAPAVTANAFNRLTHRDELYFALFKPSSRPLWNGNIKRYGVAGDPPIVVDADGKPAVDPNTGFFADNTRSFWTDVIDGSAVHLGGAAHQLTTNRKVYTYTGGSAPNNISLTASAHALSESNSALSKDMLGIAGESDDYRSTLLQWARGVDVDDEDEDGSITDARNFIGDPLHTKPALVTYGGTADNPDITLYAATNEGFLHAIDTSDGREIFAFMPKELLPNLDKLYSNAATDEHPYGLDGPITVWHKDVNRDALVLNPDGSVQSGEHVYLYVGMRRGGRNYYALDVTNRKNPKLMWQVQGGSGDFELLGQSWSRPIVAKVKLSGADRDVLIFGGGYDTTQDAGGTARMDDATGNAVYMVDAVTGARLWWAGPPGSGADLELAGMQNGFAADPRVIDINLDGYADRLYMTDVGGRVWRFDLAKGNTGKGNLAKGYMMADINDGTTAAGNRRFFYSPDVALIQDGAYKFLSIAIGSGYRAHPLDTETQDRFYMIRDDHVYGPPDSYPATVTEANLYDATANVIGQGSDGERTAAITQLNDKAGWYIRLDTADGGWQGEKVLAESLTIQNEILFTTFTPVVEGQAESCAPSQGTARVYHVNLLDATPVKNYDQVGSDETLTRSDRPVGLVRGGIPPEPVLLFPSEGEPFVMIGPEQMPGFSLSNTMERTAWEQIR